MSFFKLLKISFLGLLIISTMYYFFFEPLLETIQCYGVKSNDTLPKISDIEPRKGQSIFFLETTHRSCYKGKIVINARQACSVESAAKYNPNFDIYLLYLSPGNFKFEGDESDTFLEVLLSYRNVRIMHLDLKHFTKGTPLEELFRTGKPENSKYPIENISDILRFLTLWKYGGIYLDLDTVCIKTLEYLRLNFAGAEHEKSVGSSVLRFEPNGTGHKIVELFLEELKVNFNEEIWGFNGPMLITRMLQVHCLADTPEKLMKTDCRDFKIFPPHYFYPVLYTNWNKYFEEDSLEYLKNVTRESHILHIWNKLNNQKTIPLHSKVPYLYFAERNCPKVVAACDKVF